MKIGFIGLGNVGGKLAGNLLANGVHLTVRDLDEAAAAPFLSKGADWADSPAAMVDAVDLVITCLPSPAASAAVMEGPDGLPSFSRHEAAFTRSMTARWHALQAESTIFLELSKY